MNIKKLFSIAVFMLSPLFANAYAGESDCSKLVGHWQGIYTFKDQEICKLYNGCAHIVVTDISYVAGNDYHVSVGHGVGQDDGTEFNIRCENGLITAPIPGSKVSTVCHSPKQCFFILDNQRFMSEMVKIS